MPGEAARTSALAEHSDANGVSNGSMDPGFPEARSDPRLWRMRAVEGRQSWHYLDEEEAKKWPQTLADRWYLNLPTDLPDLPKAKKPLEAVDNGLSFFSKLQLPPGNWACEYGGPMFLLAGVVITWYVTETPIPWSHRVEIKNYLFARANPEDGGWGLHTEAESSVLGTAFNYAVLRIVGVDADHPAMVKARGTLHRLGGATHAPHWTKFWLALMGVVKWDIVNPCPPEAWLLPDWLPFHPWRWWVHIRYIYLAMSWLYSKRWVMRETELVRELRKEMFVQPWEEINWAAHRNSISNIDNFHPKSWLLNTANWVLVNVWQPYLRPNFLADKAERWVAEMVDMESENTHYLGLAPANGPMNMVVYFASKGPDSYEFKQARQGIAENMWVNHEGMFCNGTNGIQCWDTAFTIQAVIEAGLAQDDKWRPMLLKALQFLDDQQIREEVPRQYREYRHPRKGGWAFSNRWQGYPVSDCVAEALKSVILLQKTPGIPQLLEDRRIFDAIDVLLTYQNSTGGCASYERRRGPHWVELLNAAEVFENIMVEYDYPECTTAVVTTVSLFSHYWPDYRAAEIRSFVDRAVAWIKTVQYPHGGWYGNWGICFTYATMFALESLSLVGETYATSEHAKRGCEFLLSKQRPDGGWSESYRSCERHEYIEHPSGSQVVMTAWALIGLMNAGYPDVEPLRRGVKLIMDRQQPNGEWKQEAIEGVFNKSTMITYPNYKFSFTLKALGMFAQKYSNEEIN
uniref:Terpene cyclase/mutase family member n=1 Tax=Coccidioides posadasii RMSCC 3488 TaxID=454284 RepID=A0A0J6HXU3_COCPO|nr:lanosterol synthase [Coccidioides posadasii RMSCC 3488]